MEMKKCIHNEEGHSGGDYEENGDLLAGGDMLLDGMFFFGGGGCACRAYGYLL
ncbi:MAG: hypothetical protein HFH97_08870 [Lachnospiraceae bacterium]|nr:hypothetical protein [uncultured Acetatifactor sp.]MCI9572705.1 hypothetical protein [Lachnospiraceae bacterium]